jgi:hypothetical protein
MVETSAACIHYCSGTVCLHSTVLAKDSLEGHLPVLVVVEVLEDAANLCEIS